MFKSIRRRKFLAYLATLPVISEWTEALGYAHPQRPVRDEKWKSRFFAVEILRLINTAERWNFLATGQHVSKESLPQCIGYKKLVEKIPARFMNVLSKFPSDGSFQVPGYDIYVAPSTDLSKYAAAVSMKGPEYNFTFVSDEVGVISEATPLSAQAGYDEITKFLVDARGKASDAPTRNGEAHWWPRLLGTIMFSRLLGFAVPPLQLNQGCACCQAEFPCSVPSGCQCFTDCPNSNCTDGETYCCANCGTCSSCTWVRTPACEEICNCNWSTCIIECCFQVSGGCVCQCG
jgi:hypothetical protein